MENIFALFRNTQDADTAFSDLTSLGYDRENISVITQDNKNDIGKQPKENIAQGAMTGGVVGAIAGLLVGASIIALPGVGALAIAGPIAANLGISTAAASTLTGAATGALGGGLIGALVNLGVPEDQARVYEEGLSNKGVVLIVTPINDDTQSVIDTLTRNGAVSVTAV